MITTGVGVSTSVAIIGAGRMGRRHIEAVGAANVVGLCDVSADALAQTSAASGVAQDLCYRDAATMLRETSPTLVIVSSTAPSHCEYTCMAAESGAQYVVCEKPMAVSLAECDAMIETCRRTATRLAVNHPMRYMDLYRQSRDITRSEAFGGLSSVSVVTGNAGFAMNGLHYFEMFRFMTGEAPNTVTAWFSDAVIPNPRGPQFQDKAGSLRMTTESGRRFYMECGSDQGHGLVTIYSGPYGFLLTDELRGVLHLSTREHQYRDQPTTRYGLPSRDETLQLAPTLVMEPARELIRDLLAAGNNPTGEEGRLAVAALVAAYVSSESGHIPIRIDDASLPRQRVFPWA